jgi:hypothetical protein
MRVTETQLAAILKLRGGRSCEKFRAALRSVLVDGLTPAESAALHSVDRVHLNQSLLKCRATVALAYTAITGQVHESAQFTTKGKTCN